MSIDRASLCEPLETRTLFSTAFVTSGILTVVADRTPANTIVVGNSADGLSIDVSVESLTPRGVARSYTASFPVSIGITGVVIRGGLRADTIAIDETHSPFTIATRINGRSGADIINCGGEDDTVLGGLGADVINGGDGTDELHGGLGADTINGGEGNDHMWGGRGNDTLDGDAGNDRLGGVLGINILIGDVGNDEFVVRSLEKNPTNDFNSDDDTLTIRVKKEDPDPVV